MVITEKVKKTREGREGEKTSNMTRLQQLALLERAVCKPLKGLCQMQSLRDQEQIMSQENVTAVSLLADHHPTGLRWWHCKGPRGGWHVTAQGSTSLLGPRCVTSGEQVDLKCSFFSLDKES